MRFVFVSFVACALAAATGSVLADSEEWAGRALADYLDWLNRQGIRILYTSDLVGEGLRLVNEPPSGDPKASLDELLDAFGLTVQSGPAGSLVVVREASAGSTAPTVQAPKPTESPIPEIIVTSSLHRLEYSAPLTHTYVDRELATRVPTTADEAVRLTHRLQGTSSGGFSAQSHVRGGERNEVLFLFDGLRLYEPYHLKDFQAVTTIVNAGAIAGMDFYTGAFPARYGDRMSGVLSIDMREAEESLETEIAISFFNTSLLSAGRFGAQQQGDWLVTSRRGNLDLVADVVDPDFGSPDYQDHLVHVGWEFGPRARLSANFLLSDDKLSLNDSARGERAAASYSNQVGWIKWRADWSDSLESETILAISDIANRRRGSLDLGGIVAGSIDDLRDFTAAELRQDWQWLASPDWMLRFGFNLKELDARYRLASTQSVEAPFDRLFDNRPSTVRNIDVAPSGAQYAAYAELRWRLADRWTADLGLRWDQQSYTTAADDKQLSPRVSLLYQPTEVTDLRIGWGRYFQAQEINELQVSDGVEDFFPAQRADHLVLNVRHRFAGGIDAGVSVYRKDFRRLRPRFENRFNSRTLLPELQFDRARVAPSGGEARGVELLLSKGRPEDDLLWWFGYTWSESFDETAAGDLPRSWDQRNTLKAGLSWRWGRWDFSAAGEAHSGWPRTILSADLRTNPDGSSELLLDVPAPNAGRYADYHALDLRISRDFDVPRGDVTAFLEISNAYNRANPCCTEYALDADGSLTSRESHWLPLLPSLGFVWRF